MSFGDPNNPYGPPQGQPGQQPGYPPQAPQGQPGYGYPQAPQGVPPQQGYGYPQGQPAYPGFPGGNVMPIEMPGLMKTARVLLFILAGLPAPLRHHRGHRGRRGPGRVQRRRLR